MPVLSIIVLGNSLKVSELSSDLGFPLDNEMVTMSLLEGFCKDYMDIRLPALSQACGKHSRDFPPLSLDVHFLKRKMQRNWRKAGER